MGVGEPFSWHIERGALMHKRKLGDPAKSLKMPMKSPA